MGNGTKHGVFAQILAVWPAAVISDISGKSQVKGNNIISSNTR